MLGYCIAPLVGALIFTRLVLFVNNVSFFYILSYFFPIHPIDLILVYDTGMSLNFILIKLQINWISKNWDINFLGYTVLSSSIPGDPGRNGLE